MIVELRGRQLACYLLEVIEQKLSHSAHDNNINTFLFYDIELTLFILVNFVCLQPH